MTDIQHDNGNRFVFICVHLRLSVDRVSLYLKGEDSSSNLPCSCIAADSRCKKSFIATLNLVFAIQCADCVFVGKTRAIFYVHPEHRAQIFAVLMVKNF